MTATRSVKSVNDPSATIRRAARFLIPPYAAGIEREEAAMQAEGLLQTAIEQCVRAGRDDLAFKLQDICFLLRGIPGKKAAPAAEPITQNTSRRKRSQAAAPGKRYRRQLAKSGAVTVGKA